MTRPSVPAVPDRETQGRVSYVDVLLDTEPQQVIRGEIVRTDQVPPVGWVPVTDPTTPVFNHLDAQWRTLGGKPEAGPEWRLRGSWSAMLAASRAATAASRTHFVVTMAGRP